jgi:hypothetical protein
VPVLAFDGTEGEEGCQRSFSSLELAGGGGGGGVGSLEERLFAARELTRRAGRRGWSTIEWRELMSAVADLQDLQLSDEEQLAEETEETARAERRGVRYAELAELSDDTLNALLAEEDVPTLDKELATDVLVNRDATFEAEQEADAAALDEGASHAEEVRENAGEPVGEMPAGEPEELRIPPDQIVVRHFVGSKRKWAGKAPGTTVLALKGMKVMVDGAFQKGERIRFSGEAVVISEAAKDKLDKHTKTVSESVQTHDAVVLDFELDE